MENSEVKVRPDNLETVKYFQSKQAVIDAYKAVLNNKEEGEVKFLEAVIRFAKVKITTALLGTPNTHEIEDHAQEITWYVWQNLDSFRGSPDTFHSWLSKICYSHGARAQNDAIEERSLRAPLFVESEDGDMEDNPLIYNGEEIHEHTRELPDLIKGTDLMICKLIREDLTYEEIGWDLGLSEAAIKLRVQDMRIKIEALDLPQKRAEFLADSDRAWAEAKGPVVKQDEMIRSGLPYYDWITWYIGEVDRAREKYDI